MKNKTLFTFALFASLAATAFGGTTPKRKPVTGNPNPGNDSAIAAKGSTVKNSTIQLKNIIVTTNGTTTNTVTPSSSSIPKTKIVVQSKKEGTYELKAPSIFTFTVLNTYLNMPIQKK